MIKPRPEDIIFDHWRIAAVNWTRRLHGDRFRVPVYQEFRGSGFVDPDIVAPVRPLYVEYRLEHGGVDGVPVFRFLGRFEGVEIVVQDWMPIKTTQRQA